MVGVVEVGGRGGWWHLPRKRPRLCRARGVSCTTERDTDTVWVVRGGVLWTISDTSALVWSACLGGLGCLTTWASPGGQDFEVAGRMWMTYDCGRGVGPSAAVATTGMRDDRNEF